jgi:hypothetical protein
MAARHAPVALLAAALGGCFSDRGVAIEVAVGATGATTVELFLGAAACDADANTGGIACTTVAPPPDGSVALAGDIWFRDDAVPYVAQVSGGTATFQIRAATPTTVPIAIAVGYVGDAPGPQAARPVGTATLRDLAVPVHNARILTTSLVAAGPVLLAPGDTRNLTEDRVLVWRKQSPPSSCLVVEHWDHGAVDRDLVVPEDDPDCDDVPAPECNAAAYHGASKVGGARARPDCTTTSGGSACVLGAFGCQDDVPGNDRTCVALPARTCVPDALCTACPALDEACLRAQIAPATNPVARIECKVPARVGTGKLVPCSGKAETTIDLDAFFPDGTCPAPELAALPAGGGGTSSAAFDGAELALSSPRGGAACQFTLSWTGGARPSIDPLDDFGLLRFAFDDPGSSSVLLPIALRFVAGPTDACTTTAFTCDYTAVAASIDSMWTCVPP